MSKLERNLINYRDKQQVVSIICKCIHTLERYGRFSTWEVFDDVMESLRIFMYNQFIFRGADLINNEREKRFQDIQGKYGKELFWEELAKIHTCLHFFFSEDFDDILGSVFHSLELHNKWVGQFFTPYPISKMMAQISGYDNKRQIQAKSYIRVEEPACGSGGMIIAVANALQEEGFDPKIRMLAIGTDIDSRCVNMAYLQMSYAGIPAVINHGNSLTRKITSQYFTPAFVNGGWYNKVQKPMPQKRSRRNVATDKTKV